MTAVSSPLQALCILEALFAQAEPAYRDFSAALLPGVTDLWGVRIPTLRQMSKTYSKDFSAFWALACSGALDTPFEARMLQGLTLCYAKMPDEARMECFEAFLPKIDCWSVCDSVCMTAKFMAKHREIWFDWLCAMLDSAEEYRVRFALVCLLDHFLPPDSPAWCGRVLAQCALVVHPGYYARMAVAWAVSVCAVRQFALTEQFLSSGALRDDFTHNKAIQKACESFRLTPAQKSALRTLRRKTARGLAMG